MSHPIAELLSHYDAVDLSHPLHEGMPCVPTHSPFKHNLVESYWSGGVAVAYEIVMNEHSGTHVDAPAHFVQDDRPQHVWIDEVSPLSVSGRGIVIDARGVAGGAEIEVEVLHRHEQANGTFRPGDVVMVWTGWSEHWASETYMESWPGLSKAAAELLAERGVAAVGIDAIALDPSGTTTHASHHVLLELGIMILENLKGLERLPLESYFLAIPLAIVQGSGSPLRPLALVERTTGAA